MKKVSFTEAEKLYNDGARLWFRPFRSTTCGGYYAPAGEFLGLATIDECGASFAEIIASLKQKKQFFVEG